MSDVVQQARSLFAVLFPHACGELQHNRKVGNPQIAILSDSRFDICAIRENSPSVTPFTPWHAVQSLSGDLDFRGRPRDRKAGGLIDHGHLSGGRSLD